MNVETTKFCLACFIAIAVSACMWALFYYTPPAASKDVILILVGYLTAAFKDVYAYYFGSSSGSEKKTEMLNIKMKGDSNEKITDPPPAAS
jgi:hypothetical protein